MSTATNNVRGSDFAVTESGMFKSVPASGTVSHPQVSAADAYDMSPRTRKIVYLSLLAGILFLGSVAAYVWYGFYQWQKIW